MLLSPEVKPVATEQILYLTLKGKPSQTVPHNLGKDNNRFRATRKLQNGYFFEVNLSAQSIQRVSYKVMEAIELTSEDWFVTLQ